MRYLIFDTETTGLPEPVGSPVEEQPRITELGLVVMDSLTYEDVGSFESLFNPECPIPENIQKSTKITDAMVASAPLFKSEVDNILQFFEMADIILAHNLMFDYSLLKYELFRAGRNDWDFTGSFICTVEQTEWLFGYRLNLQRLYKTLGLGELDNWHRAMSDVKHTRACVMEMLKKGMLPR